jgi:16S rRNA (guanine527-N7)-methyltransferase
MNIIELNNSFVDGLEISQRQFDLLQDYLSELLRWNKKINLTAIRDEEQCWEKHILDSLYVTNCFRGQEYLLDIGSGAGLPSIPLKILLPGLKIVSVDSVAKKINFQRHIVRQLKLVDFHAEATRIELLRNRFAGEFDVVISRAFASLELFVGHALPFVKPGGRIVAMKSIAVDAELELARQVIADGNLHVTNMHTFTLQPSGSTRVIIELTKADY